MLNKQLLLSLLILILGTGMAGSHAEASSESGPIKVGVLATLAGPYAALGEDGVRGVEMAIAEVGGAIKGRKIIVFTESTDGTPSSATNSARKLVELQKVDIVIGPLSGDEGIAIRDYAKTQPNITFLNGSSAAADATLRDGSDNFYRFSSDGTQWMAGVGQYVYNKKGYKRVVTLGEDYSYPYSQVGGFVIDFCEAGGQIEERLWVPLGTTDYSSVIATIPEDIDAIYCTLGGADALNFMKQYEEFGGSVPLIAGSTTVDQSILSSKGAMLDQIVGTISGSPIASNNPEKAWQDFVARYQKTYPKGYKSPSIFNALYYVNAKAAMLAIEAVGADLSDGQVALRKTLDNLEFDAPTGKILIDENRNGIVSVFVTEVKKNDDGSLSNEVVDVVHNINQTLGMKPAEFLKLGAFDRDNPACIK